MTLVDAHASGTAIKQLQTYSDIWSHEAEIMKYSIIPPTISSILYIYEVGANKNSCLPESGAEVVVNGPQNKSKGIPE